MIFGCVLCGCGALVDFREGLLAPSFFFKCTCSASQFARECVAQERKSSRAVIQSPPISNVISQPRVSESYRKQPSKGLVPLEVIRARAKEALKKAKDGVESSKITLQNTFSSGRDDLEATNRRKANNLDSTTPKQPDTSSHGSGFSIIKSSLAILREDLSEDLASTRRGVANPRERAAEMEGLLGQGNS
eukprot:CAMPEP_0113693834 /NCGR_PEP_ID=MMETSP0038_2-20120614/19905_1 /TAXON_ID=2898 /ORGANISM="Cryptomonas paramecium" /LENGTH=189 /DNA_ID=CAMNT_0000615991 /DNA_START=19 /DNA_END=588 /DNA_ORIENTATION=- /assembly_acc=CAM_ASM_000170